VWRILGDRPRPGRLAGCLALGVMVAVAVALGSCAGTGTERSTTSDGGNALVTYSLEGGIKFRSSALAVSRAGSATLRSRGCVVRFRLGAGGRHRLLLAVKGTDLSALAGEHPAPSGAADAIAETIVVGPDKVHIEDFTSLPAAARRELAPLLGALGAVLGQGERRIGARCGGASGGRG
jgi:hypothetical protein